MDHAQVDVAAAELDVATTAGAQIADLSPQQREVGATRAAQTARAPRVEKLSMRLANASCFDFLPTVESDSIDLALIDPPYDVSRKTGFQSVKTGVQRFAVSMDFGAWDWGFEGLDRVAAECYRALRKGGTIVVFYDLWKLTILAELLKQAGFKQIRFVEWVKTNPVPINSKVNYLTNAREIAITAVKGSKPTFNSAYDNGIYEFPICHEVGRFHPTQKPLALIRQLVEKHSQPGDRVLDCFAGSATTAAAALLEGRHFTGCELDKDYHAKSVERLQALTQKDTWPARRHVAWDFTLGEVVQ